MREASRTGPSNFQLHCTTSCCAGFLPPNGAALFGTSRAGCMLYRRKGAMCLREACTGQAPSCETANAPAAQPTASAAFTRSTCPPPPALAPSRPLSSPTDFRSPCAWAPSAACRTASCARRACGCERGASGPAAVRRPAGNKTKKSQIPLKPAFNTNLTR